MSTFADKFTPHSYKTPAIRTSLIFPSFFRSPLTADWPEGGASALLGVIAPMIDLQPVVDRIVAGIEKDQGEDVVIPSHMTSLHATSTTAPWLIKDWMVKVSYRVDHSSPLNHVAKQSSSALRYSLYSTRRHSFTQVGRKRTILYFRKVAIE